MAFTYERFLEITTIASTTAAVYTKSSAATVQEYIRCIYLYNANTTAETVQLWLVPDSGGSAGTAGDTNKIYQEVLAANELRILDLGVPGMILKDVGDSVQAVTTTASKVTIQIIGGKE